MKGQSRFFTPQAGAAAGLIIGIILGSLALNLIGTTSPHAAPAAQAFQSSPPTNAGSVTGPVNHR
jgi:hypothetical protein